MESEILSGFFNRSRDRGGRDFSCLERGTVAAKRETIATEREIVVSKSERERERERDSALMIFENSIRLLLDL